LTSLPFSTRRDGGAREPVRADGCGREGIFGREQLVEAYKRSINRKTLPLRRGAGF
jgi:hypothetical protein